MTKLMISFAVLAVAGLSAQASELDPVVANAPQGLVVKVSADGKREVYKTELKSGIVDNEKAAASELNNGVKPENKIQSVNAPGELDQVTSNDSWCWSWDYDYSYGRSYYSYTYYSYGYSYSYYPSYTYYYGGSRYNYYYTPTYYGYSSGYSWEDSYGCHYSSNRGWYYGDSYYYHRRY